MNSSIGTGWTILWMIGKVLAAIVVVGSVGGILTNARYLQIHGSGTGHLGGAIAGIFGCTAILVFSIMALKSRRPSP